MTAQADTKRPTPGTVDQTFWTEIFAGLSNPESESFGGTDRAVPPTSRSQDTWIDRLFADGEVNAVAPPPPASPILAGLVDDHAAIPLWSGGVTTLKVADIAARR